MVWGTIHHKTNTNRGATHFGYPDPTYLNRMKLECADKGVRLVENDPVLARVRAVDRENFEVKG